MRWLDKKLKTGTLVKKRSLLIIGTTLLVLILGFPSQTIVRFGYREIKGLSAVLKINQTGAYLSSRGQTSDRSFYSGLSRSKAISVLKLWAAWGGTFALLVPFLLFISLVLIVRFQERQAKPPILPAEDSVLFDKIKSEVIKLYLRANRINYIMIALIVLGLGVVLSIFQTLVQFWWPLSPMLVRISIGTYILYSGLLYVYFMFYKGFSRQRIINTIDHYIGLQQGLATTLAANFEQNQSTMYHLLLGAVSQNFQHTKLARLFPWRFPELTRKNLLANLTALAFTFMVAHVSIPAIASISRISTNPGGGIPKQLTVDNTPFNESLKVKDLKYQFAQESLIIKNLSQEILKEDKSPLTKSLAEELMKLALDLSRIAMETDSFSTFDQSSTKLKGRLFSGSKFIHDQLSERETESDPEAGPLTFSEYKEPVTTKNTPASNIKKTAASLAAQVDQLIRELLVYKIKHYNKKNQIPGLKTGGNSTPASVSETDLKKTEKFTRYDYKKWKDSLKLKKMAAELNKISGNLMAALTTDKQLRPSDSRALASSSPAGKAASLTKGNRKSQATSGGGSGTSGNNKQPNQETKPSSGTMKTASSSKKPDKDEKILISYKKLKLVRSELEEAQLLLKDWSNEWRKEPRISEEIRVSGARIRELNNKLLNIIKLQELYLEGGQVPENIRANSVPGKLVSSDRKLFSPPKEVFQKMAGELGKISRKLFRAGGNLGKLPSKASDIEVIHNLGSSVPRLAQSLRREPKTVNRLIKELGKISDTLKNRNWGLSGNPAFFNPDSQNKLALRELSKKLKKIASKSEARKLGKKLNRIAERFQDSRPPEIDPPPKGLDKLSPGLTEVALQSQARRFKQGTSPPQQLPLAKQAGFTPPEGMKAPPKELKQLTPKLTGIAEKRRKERLSRRMPPPEERLLAKQASFKGIPRDYSPPPGVKPLDGNWADGGNPNQTNKKSQLEGITDHKTKRAGTADNQEWLRPQIAEVVPPDSSGGSKGTPPRQPGKGNASRNTADRQSGGSSPTAQALELQSSGRLRNQNNVRELEKIRKNSSLTGIRKGELGSGAVPHDPELLKELRKRYRGHQRPGKTLGQGKTRDLFGSRKGTSSPDSTQNIFMTAEARQAGRPNTFGMMGSNKRGMKEKPLAGQQLVEQLRRASPQRNQPESMPELTPLKGDQGSGKGRAGTDIKKPGAGKLSQKRRLRGPNRSAEQAKAAATPRMGDLPPQPLSGAKSSLSNPNVLELPGDTSDSKVTRISQAESLSGEIKHRQSLGNRNDLRNPLSTGFRSLKNRQLGLTASPGNRLSRNEQDLTSIPKQPVQGTRGHQETIPDHNQKSAEGSLKTAASLNLPPNLKMKTELPTKAGQIDTKRLPADFKRFRQKVGKLNKRLKNAQTLSEIQSLSQKISQEFSEFRSSQLGKSQPPELLAKQDRSLHKPASLNSRIQSTPTDIRQQTATRLSGKPERGLFPHPPTGSGHPGGSSPSAKQPSAKGSNRVPSTPSKPKSAGGNPDRFKTLPDRPPTERARQAGIEQAFSKAQTPELKKITKEMSKIASELLGKIDRDRLPASGRRLADLSKQLGHYHELREKQTKRLPSELAKSIKNLRNLSDKLIDNLTNRYRPEETSLLAKQILNQTKQVDNHLSKSEAQPKTLSAQADQTEVTKLEQKGKRAPSKAEQFKLQKRFQETSPLLKYGSKLADFTPTTRKPSPGSPAGKGLIKQIREITKTMELEQDPKKIRGLSNQLSQLAELLTQSHRTSPGRGKITGKNDAAAAGKPPHKQMADRVDRLAAQLRDLGATPEMNRLKSEFDRLSNHMRTLPEMISSQKGDKGLSDRNSRSSSGSNKTKFKKRKGNKLPMQAALEKRMEDKISRALNRMDRFIDKMTGFYNQKLSKERSENSYKKAASMKKDRKISKDTDSFSKKGPIGNTLSMDTDLAGSETFQRIIKRLRSQRRNLSKLKPPADRRRKRNYPVRTGKRSSSKQPTGLEGIRSSSSGEYFPGVSVPKTSPVGGSNINRFYMKNNQEHYLKVETNITDSMKEKAGLLPRRSLKAKTKPIVLKLSEEQTLDHSTHAQDVPPVYQDIIKQIFTKDKRKSRPATFKK